MTWHQEAACRGMNPLIFFPPPEPSGAKRATSQLRAEAATALEVCARCPVAAECAAAGRTEKGVWGGLIERERSPRTIRNTALRRAARAAREQAA